MTQPAAEGRRYPSQTAYNQAHPDRAFPSPDGWQDVKSIFYQQIDHPGRPAELTLDFLPGGLRGPAGQTGNLVVSDQNATSEVLLLLPAHHPQARAGLITLQPRPRTVARLQNEIIRLPAADQ